MTQTQNATPASKTTALQDMRAALRAQLEAQRGSIAPPSGRRIGTNGKVFALPSGLNNPGPLGVVILDFRITHAYYPGMYDANDIKPPVCWSIGSTLDSMPDDSVKDPNAASCSECMFNQFKSAPNGKGKACKEGRRLAVVPLDATLDTDVWTLDVSPMGIKSFEGYATRLNSNDMTLIEVCTQVAFNPKQAYPSLVFGNPVTLDNEQLATMFVLQSRASEVLDKAFAA